MKEFYGREKEMEYFGGGENTHWRKESSALDMDKDCSHLPSSESLLPTVRQDVLDA
jgi:hypothetical protein